ncbi:conserved hypothetical protein [Desulfamplus magnetovallimortis]|uniref:Uncharacterized protein n=1 Tax=Desulfamplus magnetovallimortis TaxID=1246637 RepID=A0A1W1H5T9_9BACT|nr:hypothetical protein [Desulfamplus magnetovallimortis]SLM27850.1 conserved hypothetical protein [Desulfamplus magnetovallimortis]
MEFIFSCPETGKTFSTEAFSVMDGYKVVTENNGTKRLEATVELHNPCPFCGQLHSYSADEMICPYGSI